MSTLKEISSLELVTSNNMSSRHFLDFVMRIVPNDFYQNKTSFEF